MNTGTKRTVHRVVAAAIAGAVVTAAIAVGGHHSSAPASSAAVAPAKVVVSQSNGPTGYFPDQFDLSKAKRAEHVNAF